VKTMTEKTRKPPLQIVGDPDFSGVQPPLTLGKVGRSLWDRVQGSYAINDVGGQELLAQACAAADRAEDLRGIINHDGPIIQTRAGRRDHPLLKHELQCRAFVTRTLMRLGLDVEPIKSVGRQGSGGLGITGR
jgi:hypothetical protein